MRLVRSISLILAVVALGAADSVVRGQQGEVIWSVSAPDAVDAGGELEIVFQAAISAGWYIYAIDSPAGRPLRIVTDDFPPGLVAGEPSQSGPVEGYDPNFEATVRYFEQFAEFKLPVSVAADLEDGPQTLTGHLEYMYCSDRVCIPANEQFFVQVDVSARSAEAEPSTAAAAPVAPVSGAAAAPEPTDAPAEPKPLAADSVGAASSDGAGAIDSQRVASVGPSRAPASSIGATDDLDAARSGGLLGFLLIAIGAGLAALLTPCVFPMIPLTISFFSHQSDNRGQAIRMALVFGLSIIVIFTGLGVAMALLFGAAGAQIIATNPWINLGIGIVFIVFALSLLGLFELRLPHRFVNYVNKQGDTKGGIVGVLFMGLTLTLVSFSCTAPFVGGLLAATAVSSEWTWPVLGMLVFSATFALPFVLFAMFPNWLNSLPQSGSWMNAVKVTLGFIELAAAFKFLSNADLVWGWGLLSRTLVIASWIVIFALAGFYLLGKLRLQHDEPVQGIGTVRLLFSIVFLGFSLYLFPGLLGAPLNNIDAYLPPRLATDVGLMSLVSSSGSAGHDEFDWKGNDIEPYEDAIAAALLEARETDKPVFIDFTGYTCTNCRQMESTVFPNPAVAERLKSDFVLLRLYTDDAIEGPDLQRYQLQLTGTVALPTYAVVDADGTLLRRWMGMASVDEFAAFLDQSAALLASR